MEEYLKEHGYINNLKKWNEQEELSKERAEAIINWHNNKINELKQLTFYDENAKTSMSDRTNMNYCPYCGKKMEG